MMEIQTTQMDAQTIVDLFLDGTVQPPMAKRQFALKNVEMKYL